MAARSLQFLDMDGFWGERKTSEERYYSDSFIKYVIVIEGFNEDVLFSNGNKVYVRRRKKTHNSRWMEAQDIMDGAKALESVDIAVDVDVPPTGKGLD